MKQRRDEAHDRRIWIEDCIFKLQVSDLDSSGSSDRARTSLGAVFDLGLHFTLCC
jgi:hypothetical protein